MMLLLLLLTSLVTAAETARKSALDKPTLETFVRHLLLWGPKVKVDISDPQPSEIPGFLEVRVHGVAGKASQDEIFYISKDGQKILRAAVYNIGKNPFQANIARLDTQGLPHLGKAGAPVKMVLFSDFECGFCRTESIMLRKNLLQAFPDQVRLYFVTFPLESIHPWAKEAAIAGRCFYTQSNDAFWAYHDWVFAHQNEITASNLKQKALEFGGTLSNVDSLRLSRCINTNATEKEVDKALAMAQGLKLNSTPTLFINGRRITQTIPWPRLKQIIQLELDYQKTAADAGDADCCSVKLPASIAQ